MASDFPPEDSQPEKKQKISDSDDAKDADAILDNGGSDGEDDDTPNNSEEDEDKAQYMEFVSRYPFYDSDEIKKRNLEDEYFRITKVLEESEGFDFAPDPKFFVDMVPCNDFETMAELADKAIKYYNEEHDANYSFVKVLKGNSRACRGLMLYVTFLAKVDNVDLTEIFQARVLSGIEKDEVELCRLQPKPKEDQS